MKVKTHTHTHTTQQIPFRVSHFFSETKNIRKQSIIAAPHFFFQTFLNTIIITISETVAHNNNSEIHAYVLRKRINNTQQDFTTAAAITFLKISETRVCKCWSVIWKIPIKKIRCMCVSLLVFFLFYYYYDAVSQ